MRGALAARAKPKTRRGAFDKDLAPEAHEARRAPTSRGGDVAGLLDEAPLLDETTKILLMQPDPRQRLDRALKLRQGEGRRHQFKHHRAVLDLATQPADCGREDTAMVDRHRRADAIFWRRASEIARGLGDQ